MAKYQLVITCHACPEQYDVFDGKEKVGYLRLRHGYFRAEHGGRVVYESYPNGDGVFDDDERDCEINKAIDAIDSARSESRKWEIVDEPT